MRGPIRLSTAGLSLRDRGVVTLFEGSGEAQFCYIMRKIFMAIIGFCALCWACEHKAPEPGAIAAQTAKAYYDYLLQGKYEEFIDGRYQPDSIPANYREQLITNARMYVGQMEAEHKGLKSVRVVSNKVDTSHHSANAFLILTYGDSTSEEIVVPMVERKGVWYMR